MVFGCLWGICAEVVAGQAFPLVTGVQPRVCKSIAKASKVRILHLPPRAEKVLDDLRKRRSGALSCGPAVIGSNRLSTAVRVTSYAHLGLVSAIGAILPGVSWQRCRTHYAATLMTITPKTSWPWVRTLLHSIYDQPDVDSVVARYDRSLSL